MDPKILDSDDSVFTLIIFEIDKLDALMSKFKNVKEITFFQLIDEIKQNEIDCLESYNIDIIVMKTEKLAEGIKINKGKYNYQISTEKYENSIELIDTFDSIYIDNLENHLLIHMRNKSVKELELSEKIKLNSNNRDLFGDFLLFNKLTE